MVCTHALIRLLISVVSMWHRELLSHDRAHIIFAFEVLIKVSTVYSVCVDV